MTPRTTSSRLALQRSPLRLRSRNSAAPDAQDQPQMSQVFAEQQPSPAGQFITSSQCAPSSPRASSSEPAAPLIAPVARARGPFSQSSRSRHPFASPLLFSPSRRLRGACSAVLSRCYNRSFCSWFTGVQHKSRTVASRGVSHSTVGNAAAAAVRIRAAAFN